MIVRPPCRRCQAYSWASLNDARMIPAEIAAVATCSAAAASWKYSPSWPAVDERAVCRGQGDIYCWQRV